MDFAPLAVPRVESFFNCGLGAWETVLYILVIIKRKSYFKKFDEIETLKIFQNDTPSILLRQSVVENEPST